MADRTDINALAVLRRNEINRYLLPIAAVYGAILVVAADLLAKLVIAPSEIPMGIVTAAVGAPFLLYLVKFRP